jgi:hypothetical protein
MKKLEKFSSTEKINCSRVWGGYTEVCWTHTTDKGGSTDPCGGKDDVQYMTNDGSGGMSTSSGGAGGGAINP